MPAYLLDRINEKALRKTQRPVLKTSQRPNPEPAASGPVIHNHYMMFQPFDAPKRQGIDISTSQSTIFSPYVGVSQIGNTAPFRSSPAASESDDDREMDAYMDYLIARHPMKADKLGDI